MLDTLIKDRDFFEYLINQIDCPLVYLSGGNTIEVANAPAITLLQLNPHQYVGIDIQALFLERNCSLSHLFSRKNLTVTEKTHPNGETTSTILWKIKPLTFPKENCNDALLIGYDITESKLISEELHSKVFFYENILSKLPTNVYWKDRNCIYLGCNERLAKVMGLPSREAVRGMTDFDFSWNKEAAQSFIEFDKKVMESGIPLTTEDTFEEANGNIVTVLTSKTPLQNEAGDSIGVLAISVDITELKRTQKKLNIEKQKSEAASKAKSEFIANMSHDLRTPITGILGMAQDLLNTANQTKSLLNDKKFTEHSTRLEAVIKTVKRDSQFLMTATYELLQLCNEILDVTKLESGKLSNRLESFNLDELISHNLELLRPLAQNRKLALYYELDEAIPRYLKGLRIYLDRTLLNLMSNALKFTEEGFVKIKASLAQPTHKTLSVGDPITLKISVEDSGIGIPEDKFEMIFEHFSRLNPAYQGLYKGAGLGLYTVKHYVKAMQGHIHLDSELGKGTCFTLTLPLSISDHTEQNKQPLHLSEISIPKPMEDLIFTDTDKSISPNEAKASVLIVEDQPLAAYAVNLHLKALHCYVEVAENGEKAVKMAQENDYDLILMDIGLPDFSGIEVSKKIRKISNLKKSEVPIVALTGHADNIKMRQKAIEAGMQDIINKPAQPPALEAILQKYVFNIIRKAPEPLQTIDWKASLQICGNDPESTAKMLSMLVTDLKKTKSTLDEAYHAKDFETLRAELHRLRGAVCYLKMPELEHALNDFHEAITINSPNPQTLETTYLALRNAIGTFQEAWDAQNSLE